MIAHKTIASEINRESQKTITKWERMLKLAEENKEHLEAAKIAMEIIRIRDFLKRYNG